jgi:hypothetical protein
VLLLGVLALALLGLGLSLIHECAYTAGMGANYRFCQCSGYEWVYYDRTAADGPRKTICLGFVSSRGCALYMGGPAVSCQDLQW